MAVILQTFPLPDGPKAALEADHEVRTALFVEGDELAAAARGCIGVIAGTELWTAQHFDLTAGRLRAISRVGTGVDGVDLAAATAAGVAVLNAPGENAQTVAEYSVGMMWALARRVREADQSVRTEGFAKRGELLGHELAGKTAGIVGFGEIGRRTAKICRHGYDMRVLVATANPDIQRLADAGIEAEFVGLPELLRTADFVSLHTPVTEQTERMIGPAEIEQMKPGVIIINSARGQLVDEDALAQALQAGRIGGYGADVFAQEPPPADHPLFGAPNTLLSPHFGSHSHDAMYRMSDRAVRNLLEFLGGGRPTATVNPEVYAAP